MERQVKRLIDNLFLIIVWQGWLAREMQQRISGFSQESTKLGLSSRQ